MKSAYILVTVLTTIVFIVALSTVGIEHIELLLAIIAAMVFFPRMWLARRLSRNHNHAS